MSSSYLHGQTYEITPYQNPVTPPTPPTARTARRYQASPRPPERIRAASSRCQRAEKRAISFRTLALPDGEPTEDYDQHPNEQVPHWQIPADCQEQEGNPGYEERKRYVLEQKPCRHRESEADQPAHGAPRQLVGATERRDRRDVQVVEQAPGDDRRGHAADAEAKDIRAQE